MAQTTFTASAGRIAMLELVETPDVGRGPVGMIKDISRRAIHGVYDTRAGDARLRLVLNNGVLYSRWGYPPTFRTRFTSAVHSDMNYVLAHRSWLYRSRGALRVTHPMDAVVERVCAGLKPMGLADTREETLAADWIRRARRAGLAVRRERWDDPCAGHRPVYFVSVAARSVFAALADLDTLAEDYASLGLPDGELKAVFDAIDQLRGVTVAELLDDEELANAYAPHELVRTGLALGYSPTSTASLIAPDGWHDWMPDDM